MIFVNDGFIELSPANYQRLVKQAIPSPLRNKCHIEEYHEPNQSCEYFGERVSWAVFGDSHATEIAYALAKKIQTSNVGVKHFTFSGCVPSYGRNESFSKCAKWYNDTAQYILESSEIENVVFNHRFSDALLGGKRGDYIDISDELSRIELEKKVSKLMN